MKLRHAAALALVGWYFMVPPIRVLGPKNDPNTPVEFDAKAPLSEWKIIQGFDAIKDCYDEPAHLEKLLHDPNPAINAVSKEWFEKGECIATDDPRLKSVAPK
jgi:hypothetical protein